LFERGFEILDDFLSDHVRVREIVGLFQAFISEPEDVEAGLVAIVKTSLPLFFRSRTSPLIHLDVPYPHPA